ncbi:hypothetical protein ACOI1C_04205 [Bacillus sp. DJP31]
MNSLNKHTKQKIFEALNGEKSGAFLFNGKLVSIEIENPENEFEKNMIKT